MNLSVCSNVADVATQELANPSYIVGLDPPTLTTLSPLLYRLAQNYSPRLVLALRQQDPVPDWITHLIYLGPNLRITCQGLKADVLQELGEQFRKLGTVPPIRRPMHIPRSMAEIGRVLTPTGIVTTQPPPRVVGVGVTSLLPHDQATIDDKREHERAKAKHYIGQRDYPTSRRLGLNEAKGSLGRNFSREGYEQTDTEDPVYGEPLVEMDGVTVKYGNKEVLGDWTQIVDGQPKKGLWWQICRGQRWGVFGPNGRKPHSLRT